MRMWHRPLLSLALAPIVWQLGVLYLAVNSGGSNEALAVGSPTSLLEVYLAYTLPAAVTIVVLLMPADRLLAWIGADLLIVTLAPILALAVPVLLRVAFDSPRLDGAGLDGLAFLYGLVFGLTVREPRPTPTTQDTRA